jgi:hypothetical protein
MDIGKPDNTIFLAGMGRSGTTWAGDIINHDNRYRVLFEPFFPKKVKEAKAFEYIQYLSPQSNNEGLTKQAKAILAGKPRNLWVDRANQRILYRRRIIKDIRCNLMLGWLKQIAPNLPIVIMIRHPLQVASSWLKLGWGKEALGNRSDVDIITSQRSLLNDFPIIDDVMKRIDLQDVVENIIFEWSIYHLIPSQHLKTNEAYTLFFESLLTNFGNESIRLFQYLDTPFNPDKLLKTKRKSSSTNVLGRDFNKDQPRLLAGWRDEFSTKQIQRADYILSAFELNDIYDKKGYPTGAPFFGD